MQKHLAVLFALAILGGCAWTPQSVVITPEVTVPEGNIGNGRGVQVNVVDERPKQTLGTRGVKGVGAELSIQGDLTTLVRDAITHGMRRQGFDPVTTASGRELRVEIRSLDYEVLQGFWAGTLRVDATLKGICVRDGQRPYEKLHRGEYKESVQLVKDAETNNRIISQTVSQAVNSLLADAELARCLAN
jgi:uncharacterized lipoprotein